MTNMIIGGYELTEMGLNNTGISNEITNFFIYFVFLILMTIISVNLLTGIAIGELQSVLKEAEIYNIQQRIFYILHIQKIIFIMQKRVKSLLNIKHSNILIQLMKFKNEDTNIDLTERSPIMSKIWKWFKKNSKVEIENIENEKSDKCIGDYFAEVQYNGRIERDFILNKMNEQECKLTSIEESLEIQRIEQMKKINEIDLSVSKNEKQLSEIVERLEIEVINKNERRFVELSETLGKQISEIMTKLNEIAKVQDQN